MSDSEMPASDTAARHDAGPARGVRILFLVVGLSTVTADIASKYGVAYWVENYGVLQPLTQDFGIVLIPGWLMFEYRLNPGGMFSALHGWEHSNLFLASVSVAAVLAILVWGFVGVRRGEWLLGVILGLILGGACGNLYDRLMFGAVRDFVHAHYGDVYSWPTFNLADSCLVVGAALLVLRSFLYRPADAEAPAGESTSAATVSSAPGEG